MDVAVLWGKERILDDFVNRHSVKDGTIKLISSRFRQDPNWAATGMFSTEEPAQSMHSRCKALITNLPGDFLRLYAVSRAA